MKGEKDMSRYNLSSSQSDRQSYDHAILQWAQECFKESEPTEATPLEAARAHWALERDLQEVDDMDEAEARYLAAFAQGWAEACAASGQEEAEALAEALAIAYQQDEQSRGTTSIDERNVDVAQDAETVMVGIFPNHEGGSWDIYRYRGADGFDFDHPLLITTQISLDDVLAGFEWGREQCWRHGWTEMWRPEIA